jgi:hypothetical protein
MKRKPNTPETPDEAIPQDPGVPGPGTKERGDWPPEAPAAASSAREDLETEPADDAVVSEAIGRTPRHRADEEHETER